MRIIIILTLSILLFSYTLYAEESKEAKITPDKDVEIEVLKERIKGNEEKINIQLKKLEDEIALRTDTLEKTINSKYESTKEATGFVSLIKDWGIYFGGFIILIIAIWRKGLESIWYYPILELDFDNYSDVWKLRTAYPYKDENKKDKIITLDAYYFRFQVKNNGNVTAEDVEVFVNQLEEQQADGKYKVQTGFIPLNLVWSHIDSIYFRQIPPHMERHCDLGNIAHPHLRRYIPEYALDLEIKANDTLFSIAYKVKTISPLPHRLLPNKYKLKLLITASNVKKPKSYEFTIEHNGKWFDNKVDMLQKGIGIKFNSA